MPEEGDGADERSEVRALLDDCRRLTEEAEELKQRCFALLASMGARPKDMAPRLRRQGRLRAGPGDAP